MNLTKNLPKSELQSWALLMAFWIPACVLIYLLAMLPYATGYSYSRIPLLTIASGQWSEKSDWEHCGLVPIACAFIIYLEKDRLAKIVPKPSVWGLGVLVLGFFTYWVGYRVNVIYVGYAAIQILSAGCIISFLGWRLMSALLFPWCFLVFMWPLTFLDTSLAFPLRLIMSEASVGVLNAIGIPAIQSGTAILSASESIVGTDLRPAGKLFSVDVADPCSGIRSLFALMMVSALYGYFTLSSAWKRLVLFLCAAPLAVMGNLFRILMLTMGTMVFGSEFAIGKGLEEPSTFHMAAGFAVFGVALAGMLVIHKGLEWSPRKKVSNSEAQASEPKLSKNAKPIEVEDEY